MIYLIRILNARNNGVHTIIFLEMSQDLTEHTADKLKRVQQKLNNLRKAAMGE